MHSPGHRQAGILLPAFSPRRDGDMGIGDTIALREWVDWAADHGIGFIQLLPINENGPDESPYSAISSAALDPIYLAFDDPSIPWLGEKDLVRARKALGSALLAEQVDYPAVRKAKRHLLEIAWKRYGEADAASAEEFSLFKSEQADWLNDYCLFRFLMEYHGVCLSWDQWPENCNTPEKARAFVEKLRRRNQITIDSQLEFFAFVQWLCFRQWRSLRAHADSRKVKLMGDIPIGISWHSCDVFFQRQEFDLDWYGGSPPEGMSQSDPFFQQWGQNWGIPLYRWDRMEAGGFTWWRKRIARLTEFFQIFRLDHILGFYRIYAFPWRPERNPEFLGLSHEQAAELTGGPLPRWVERPDDTQENKNANLADGDIRLRGVLADTEGIEVIAEDLGWVPEYVRPHLTGLGIAGFRIPHWDCDEFGHPTPGDRLPENSFATYSTHDHAPLNGIWNGCLLAIQRHQQQPDINSGWQADGAQHTLRILSEFADIPIPRHGPWPPYTEGIRLRLLKALLSSNACYAVVMITELFSLDVRINVPGTTSPDNWSFRLPWTLAHIRSDYKLSDTCRKFAALIGVTGRAIDAA